MAGAETGIVRAMDHAAETVIAKAVPAAATVLAAAVDAGPARLSPK